MYVSWKKLRAPSVSEEIADIFRNYNIEHKVSDEITHPFLNFNGATVEV